MIKVPLSRIKKVYSPEDYQYSIQTEDFVWITPFRAGSIKRIEISNGTEIFLPIPNSDELFHRGFNLGKYVVMMPAGDGRDFLMIDKETNSVHKLTGDFKGIRSKNTEWFEMCEISADQGYWCAASDGNIFEFSEDGQIVNTYATETEVETIKMTMNKVYQDKQMPIEWMLDDIALERPGIGDLSDFIINI